MCFTVKLRHLNSGIANYKRCLRNFEVKLSTQGRKNCRVQTRVCVCVCVGPAGSFHSVTPVSPTERVCASEHVCGTERLKTEGQRWRCSEENRGALCRAEPPRGPLGCSSRSTARGEVVNCSGLLHSAPTHTHTGRGGRLAACVSTHSLSLWRGSTHVPRCFLFNIQ